MNLQPTSLFLNYFWLSEMAISKGHKPDNFELHNCLQLRRANIQDLPSNFVECESFLELNSPDIPGLCEKKLDDSIDSWQYVCEGLSSFNPKGFCHSYTGSCTLCEGRTLFCKGLTIRKLFDSYLSFQMALLHSVCYFFFLYQSPSS